MTLMSVVMIALGAAMRTMAKTEERVGEKVAYADEFRVAVSFLRTTMGRISAKRIVAAAQPGAIPYLFSAQPDTVAWVGIMPARYGAGGRTFFRLSVEDVNTEKSLVIRFLPWSDSNGFPDWSSAESRVLVSKVRSFAIRYEDDRVNPTVWSADWTKPEYLPKRVLLNIQTTSAAWPDLVITLRSPPASNPGGGGFVIGGSG